MPTVTGRTFRVCPARSIATRGQIASRLEEVRVLLRSRRAFLGMAAASAGAVALSSCVGASSNAKRLPRLGYFVTYHPIRDPALAPLVEAFLTGLRELGYDDGQTIDLVWGQSEGQDDRWDTVASEFVRMPVDVMAASAAVAQRAAIRATSSIPIVMTLGADPVEQGLAKSLARPGGNVTGMASLTSVTAVKRLELMKEAFPSVTRVALLGGADPASAIQFSAAEAAARALRLDFIRLEIGPTDPSGELERALELATKQSVDALVVLSVSAQVSALRKQIVAYAASRRLPAAYPNTGGFVDDGGLLGYSESALYSFHRAASFVDRILRGARAAELPIEQITTFDLVVNLKTARELGLTIPASLLARATRVIQ